MGSGEAADEGIFPRLRRREPAALEVLVRQYGPALRRAAYLFLGRVDAAEDVTQETFIAAWDRAPRAAVDTQVRPWLFGILFNRCRKYRRSFWRRLRREKAAAERRDESTAASSPDEQLDGLLLAMGRLSDDLRTVVILRFERDMSVAETATALGVPEGTIKSRTHAALKQLREYMRQQDG
jgi:RNA polymerase sigma-70 factor (ECF subfamily)